MNEPQEIDHISKVKEVAGHITPVPGGIGPVCVMELLQNTLNNAIANIVAPPENLRRKPTETHIK
jgi:hypothetical protein